MKFQQLELSAYGPFTGKQLAFSERPLQLIYGPNEAGKSTTLRALTGLLYGIDARTSDAHTHDMSKLRVGATLLDADGRALSVVRRKGSKNTLLDPAGEPIHEGALSSLLGGLDEKLFKQMFGLDHERLREGAEALLRAGGQLGEVLFDASTGGRSVHLALAQLRAEAEGLWKARGQTPLLNAAVSAFKESKRARDEKTLLPQAYVVQQEALAEAKGQRLQLAEQRTSLSAEKAKLTRQLALLPLIAKRDQLLEELGTLRDVAAVSEAPVRALEQRLAQLLAGERELPAARVTLAGLQREVAQLEQRLGGVAALYSLDSASKARLRKLVEARTALASEQADLRRRDAERGAELLRVDAALLALPPATPGLATLLAEIEREDLVARLARSTGEIDKLRAQLQRRMSAFAGVELACVLPSDDELSALESTFEHGARERARLKRVEAEQAAELERLQRAERELRARGALVSREDLLAVRRQRDHALDALLAGGPAAAQLRAHSALNERADGLADRMVDEAQRAAELASVAQLIANVERARVATAGELTALDEQERCARQRWNELLEPWRLASSRTARAGVSELRALQGLAAELESLGREHSTLELRAQQRALELGEALQSELDLHALLREARARVAREVETERERARLGAQRERLHGDALEARMRVVADELSKLEERYRAEIGACGVTLAPEELVACFDELSQLAQHLRSIEALRDRERALQQERERLNADARALSSEDRPLELLIEQLAKTTREHAQAQRDRARLGEELRKLDEQIAQASEGQALEALRLELSGVERDLARARLLELDDALEAVTEQIEALDQRIGSLVSGLARLCEDSGAAELAQRYEQDLAHARSLARRYVEVKLALCVLEREVERYRSEHQAPLLRRASQLFQRLTLHRYRALKVEYADDDSPVLACVLGAQTSVRVNGLSDGTRDQLYLALRVASIEHYCQSRQAMPLILDDALIHFDDARAAAALEVLAELGRHTQVLFFTHHARMVELARAALPESALQVHELAPRTPARSDGPLFDSNLS
jgi:uncharacterized protein YhaN